LRVYLNQEQNVRDLLASSEKRIGFANQSVVRFLKRLPSNAHERCSIIRRFAKENDEKPALVSVSSKRDFSRVLIFVIETVVTKLHLPKRVQPNFALSAGPEA
jgi:hypothetical protein